MAILRIPYKHTEQKQLCTASPCISDYCIYWFCCYEYNITGITYQPILVDTVDTDINVCELAPKQHPITVHFGLYFDVQTDSRYHLSRAGSSVEFSDSDEFPSDIKFINQLKTYRKPIDIVQRL